MGLTMDGDQWIVRVRYEVNGTTILDELESAVRPSMQLWPGGRALIILDGDYQVFYGNVYRMECVRGR
jgi:hypothetical protein